MGGLGWRTVVSFAIDRNGVAGLRRHRSHEVVEIDRVPDRSSAGHGCRRDRRRDGRRRSPCEVASRLPTGERGVLVGPGRAVGRAGLPDAAGRHRAAGAPSGERIPVRGRGYLTQRAAGRDWRVSLGGFWQVHPGAADMLAAVVLAALEPAARRDGAGPVLRGRPVRRRAGRGGRPGRRRRSPSSRIRPPSGTPGTTCATGRGLGCIAATSRSAGPDGPARTRRSRCSTRRAPASARPVIDALCGRGEFATRAAGRSRPAPDRLRVLRPGDAGPRPAAAARRRLAARPSCAGTTRSR